MKGINTVVEKKVAQMFKLEGNKRIYVQRFINRNHIEISNTSLFDPDSKYRAQKLGETNIFEGIIQSKLYEVYVVDDQKSDKTFEVWRSIETNSRGHHDWLIGEMKTDDYYGCDK
jgi:ABC-type Fe3+/spermidine/putrescine transport system ATPase subunit